MNIHKQCEELVTKYGTNNPCELSDYLNIKVYQHELGSINGYYLLYKGVKNIVVNEKLPYYMQKFVVAHEIGHSILHPNANAFLLSGTTYHTDKQELEADTFAIHLLITDEMLNENKHRTVGDWSVLLGLPYEVIELRFGV